MHIAVGMGDDRVKGRSEILYTEDVVVYLYTMEGVRDAAKHI